MCMNSLIHIHIKNVCYQCYESCRLYYGTFPFYFGLQLRRNYFVQLCIYSIFLFCRTFLYLFYLLFCIYLSYKQQSVQYFLILAFKQISFFSFNMVSDSKFLHHDLSIPNCSFTLCLRYQPHHQFTLHLYRCCPTILFTSSIIATAIFAITSTSNTSCWFFPPFSMKASIVMDPRLLIQVIDIFRKRNKKLQREKATKLLIEGKNYLEEEKYSEEENHKLKRSYFEFFIPQFLQRSHPYL